jgi:hypothetical protein
LLWNQIPRDSFVRTAGCPAAVWHPGNGRPWSSPCWGRFIDRNRFRALVVLHPRPGEDVGGRAVARQRVILTSFISIMTSRLVATVPAKARNGPTKVYGECLMLRAERDPSSKLDFQSDAPPLSRLADHFCNKRTKVDISRRWILGCRSRSGAV